MDGSSQRTVPVADAQRSRRTHTRSRNGCMNCKERHIRCDEGQPSCSKCLSLKASCRYAPAKLPLRDRRLLEKQQSCPWAQEPWQAQVAGTSGLKPSHPTPSSTWQVASNVPNDPYIGLPIDMSYMSKQLLYYFYQVGDAFGVRPQDPKNDCIALVAQDPSALRNTLLIGSLHYAWNTGQLGSFESTFFFHKIQATHAVNGWLQKKQSKMATACIRHIATLCFTECCLGHLKIAEMHLEGLVAAMDLVDPRHDPSRPAKGWDSELGDRYLLLVTSFVYGLKARACEFQRLEDIQNQSTTDETSPDEIAHMMRLWHKDEPGGLDARLKSMRLFPYFFCQPSGGIKGFGRVNATPFICCLRDITEEAGALREGIRASGNAPGSSIYDIFNHGGLTRLFLAYVDSHVTSLNGKDDTSPSGKPIALLSSWCGIAASSTLYLHAVLGLMNAGLTMEKKLHRRLLRMLKRDIESMDEGTLGKMAVAERNLWLWKIFVGAVSLNAIPLEARDDASLRLEIWYRGYLTTWSQVTAVKKWEDARVALSSVAWPDTWEGESASEKIWENSSWK